MNFNKTLLVAAVLSTSMLSGCSSTDEKGMLDEIPSVDHSGKDASTRGYKDGNSLSGQEFGDNANLGLGSEFSDPSNPLSKSIIYFKFDSSQVRNDYVSVVMAHATYLKDHPLQHIVLEGHADERGSREYNIALGEQRSKSVYKRMISQGVSTSQIEIMSYGEEKPDAYGMSEESWSQNRRVAIAYQGR
ncbi:MAG: peptidoglycan-associated lipoprotein Pal [Methylococcales bacterium]|nr:peptidoglycan-associated lipoprotein Pal [Methylococcales bacterium]